MLFFCEKCNLLNEQNFCRLCGKDNLRNIQNSDYCYLFEAGQLFGEMFLGILEDEGIPYSSLPSGNGARSQFALRLENLKIFVVYEFYDKAKALLNDILTSYDKANRIELEKNINKLFVTNRNEKKIKRILKPFQDDNIIGYCIDKIMNADRIVNKGRISGCGNGGDYLYVYKDKELIIINSATYEIISIEIING